MKDRAGASAAHPRAEQGDGATRSSQMSPSDAEPDRVPWRTEPPKPPPVPFMPPNYKVQPTIAPSQYVFITLAVVGVLVSGFLLFDSFSGSGRVLSDDAFSQLANSNKNEPYQQGGGASEQASRMVGMSILSDPPMATVYVDFDSMGVTPVSPDALEAGTYFLSVSKPGYMTYDTLVTLQSGEHPLLWFTLDPWDTDALGQVAQVRRDREIETPMRLLPPESAMPAAGGVEGDAPVDASRLEAAQSITVGGDEEREVPEEAGSDALATLVVLVRPWGAIYINGDMHRSNTDVAYTVRLPAGVHLIRAVHPALGSVERTVRVSPETPERIIFNLTQRSTQGTSPVADTQDSEPAAAANVAAAQVEDAEPVSDKAEPAAVAEEPPVLVGGLEALQRLARYPEKAYTFGVEGRVFLRFIVDEEGRVQNPVVTRGLGMGCDEEALRVVRQARFRPGRIGGEPVAVRHALSIIFKREQ